MFISSHSSDHKNKPQLGFHDSSVIKSRTYARRNLSPWRFRAANNNHQPKPFYSSANHVAGLIYPLFGAEMRMTTFFSLVVQDKGYWSTKNGFLFCFGLSFMRSSTYFEIDMLRKRPASGQPNIKWKNYIIRVTHSLLQSISAIICGSFLFEYRVSKYCEDQNLVVYKLICWILNIIYIQTIKYLFTVK